MNIQKHRLEGLSDAVIAIIITIMVLEIPLPETFNISGVMNLLHAILIFFISFMIVGIQWQKHRHMFDKVESLTNKDVWLNMIYLFSISLIPLFTKWMIENPGEVVPAIAYDILYLVMSLVYHFIFTGMVGRHIEINDKTLPLAKVKKMFYIRMIMSIIGIGIVIWISLYYPTASIVFFMAIPVGVSILNIFDDHNTEERQARQLAFEENRPQFGHRQKTLGVNMKESNKNE